MSESDHLVERVRRLEDEVRAAFPDAATETTEFPSGAVDLDVRMAGRLFVLRYFPSYRWFGVDEVLDDEGFTNHYRLGSSNFVAASAQLLGLLRAATTAPTAPR